MNRPYAITILLIILTGCIANKLSVASSSSQALADAVPTLPSQQITPVVPAMAIITKYTYTQPPTELGLKCAKQCQVNHKSCKDRCRNSSDQCIREHIEQAESHFNAYLQRQHKSGEPIEYKFDDFYDDSRCGRECQCSLEYNSCFQLCGGQITIHKRCIANCK